VRMVGHRAPGAVAARLTGGLSDLGPRVESGTQRIRDARRAALSPA
jgi:hypothetical protein